jgi:hypothetical protein
MAYSAGTFSLEIEDQFAGYLNTVEGGEPFATVAVEAPDANKVMRKHVAAVNYTPIQLSFGSPMEPPLYQWIADMLKGTQSARNGAVVSYDYNMIEKERIEFTHALITRIVFPELDGTSNVPALFRVTLQPERTNLNHAKAGSREPVGHPKAKRGLASNFRLAISNNLPTNKVKCIESIVASQSITAASQGETHEFRPSLQPLEISNLVFSVAEADSAPMYAWSDDFLLAGNRTNTNERSGTLDLFDATLSNSLFTLTLSNIGVVRVQREAQAAGAALVASIRVEAYVEQLSLPPVQQTAAPQRTAPVALKPILETLSDRSKDEAARAIRSAAGMKSADPAAIAQRFKAAPSGVRLGSLYDAGILIGTQWASQIASLDEARQIAELTSRDWNGVRLEQSHSLVAKLVDDGLLQSNHDGPIDLARDGFTEGLIVGASRVVQSVSPMLDGGAARPRSESQAARDLDLAMAAVKDSLDSLSEMGETESLRLQMAIDRLSKLMSTLSNLLKKVGDTADSITQNLK